MKKIFTVLGVVAVAVFANAQNLVTNPGFENGTTGWTAGTGSGYALPTIATDGPHTGANYVKYTPSATTGFYQDVAINPSTTYTVSYWYKAVASGSTGNTGRMWCGFRDSAGGTITYQGATADVDPLRNNNSYVPAASAWTQVTVQFTSPATAALFNFQLRAYNGSTFSVDDVSLTTGTLAVGEVLPSKYRMIKNTFVKNDEITFGADTKDVKVYTLTGQLVKTASVKANETLNVADLAEGNYIVTGTVNNQAVSQKILKN